MPKISGGCLCGSVRYTSEAEPALVAVCHCATCQKNTGSAFSLNLALPTELVTITVTVLQPTKIAVVQAVILSFGGSARSAVLRFREAATPILG